jgi:hypothetical protein
MLHDLRRIGSALLVLALTSTALAEPVSEAIKSARKRFQEGVAAADAGNYEAARIAFQQAYALKPHASVLRNLGQVELRTGHSLDAARHLSTFLRDTTFGTPADRESAQQSLAEAESKIGRIVIEVDVEGAEASIDGELIGRAPFGSDPFYAEPGARKLKIKKDGYADYEQTIALDAGRTAHVSVTLHRPEGDELAPAAATAPPAIAESAAQAPTPPPARAPEPITASTSGGLAARTVVLIGGAVLTGVALGVGIVATARASSLDREADEIRDRLPGEGCVSSAGSASSCSDLQERLDARNHANVLATEGFIAAGVLGVATGVAYIVWPRSPAGASRLELSPGRLAGGAGLWLRGSF